MSIGGAGSGAGPSFRGDLAELRVVAGALDEATRGQIEAEIRARWLEDHPVAAESTGAESFELLTGSTSPFARPAAERDAWLASLAARKAWPEYLRQFDRERDTLPSQQIVLTGGGSQIPGLDGLAARILGAVPLGVAELGAKQAARFQGLQQQGFESVAALQHLERRSLGGEHAQGGGGGSGDSLGL